MERNTLWLTGLTGGQGDPTQKGRDMAVFAEKEAEDTAIVLAGVLVQQGWEAFVAPMAESMEAMFVSGTIAASSLMPRGKP